MRRFAYLAATGITFIALVFSGFAVFAPVPVDAPAEPPSLRLPDGRGLASGRLASMSFIIVAADVQAPPIEPNAAMLSALADVSVGREGRRSTTTTSTTTTSTTTTVPPTTSTSITTTTTVPTTTTTGPTTTTTMAPSTTTTTTATSTTIPTTTTTTPPSSPLTESQMRELAARFFPAEEVEKAVLVAKCESGYNPNAYNPSGPYGGLYQHLESAWPSRAIAAGYPGASIFNAEANTAASAWLLARASWDSQWPWCSKWADGQLGG